MSTYRICKGRAALWPADRLPNPFLHPQSSSSISSAVRLPVGRGLTPEGLNLRISMPAIVEGDFSFSVDADGLTVFGVRREPVGFGEADLQNYALDYGQFHQRIPLPPGLDYDDLEARFHHGVLDVHIPFPPGAGTAAIHALRLTRTEPQSVYAEAMTA